MAIRLSGPKPVSAIGGTLRGGWYDSYRMQRHGHMGAEHETLASQRDPPCDTASERGKWLRVNLGHISAGVYVFHVR